MLIKRYPKVQALDDLGCQRKKREKEKEKEKDEGGGTFCSHR